MRNLIFLVNYIIPKYKIFILPDVKYHYLDKS